MRNDESPLISAFLSSSQIDNKGPTHSVARIQSALSALKYSGPCDSLSTASALYGLAAIHSPLHQTETTWLRYFPTSIKYWVTN